MVLALGAAGGLTTIAYTPLAFVWFHNVSGLSLELAVFALLPLKILAVFPALSVALAVERGLLVHAHRTAAITWATLLEVFTVAAALMAGIHVLGLVGAVAAALAVLTGRIVGNLWLVPPCLDVLRNGRAVETEPAAASAAAAE
jgi:hypothetical protein